MEKLYIIIFSLNRYIINILGRMRLKYYYLNYYYRQGLSVALPLLSTNGNMKGDTKMRTMNTGTIYNNLYKKYVSFSKAVLWKDRQLSLPKSEMDRIRFAIADMEFIDIDKNEIWHFKFNDVMANRQLKTVGQESQYYFDIDMATKSKLNNTT